MNAGWERNRLAQEAVQNLNARAQGVRHPSAWHRSADSRAQTTPRAEWQGRHPTHYEGATASSAPHRYVASLRDEGSRLASIRQGDISACKLSYRLGRGGNCSIGPRRGTLMCVACTTADREQRWLALEGRAGKANS